MPTPDFSSVFSSDVGLGSSEKDEYLQGAKVVIKDKRREIVMVFRGGRTIQGYVDGRLLYSWNVKAQEKDAKLKDVVKSMRGMIEDGNYEEYAI